MFKSSEKQSEEKSGYLSMIIKFLREISFTSFWWVVLGLDVFCLAVFVTILPGRSRNRIGLRVATSVLLKAAGVEVDVKGLENITTNQPYVFVANHQSWFDSFVLAAILPVALAFAPKKEMYRVPVCSYTMRLLHFVCVDRTHPRNVLKYIDTIAALIGSDISFIVYPEGTRSETGKLGQFTRGAVLLADRACVPIIPVILVGTREIMPRDTFWITYGRRVKVIILSPLSVNAADKGEQMAITEKIRQQIAGILEHQRSNNGVLD